MTDNVGEKSATTTIFLAKVNDSEFSDDREKTQTLVDLHEHSECFWDMHSYLSLKKSFR